MRKHEEFESMCALALIGQLPSTEHRELLVHMRTCELCCRSAREFAEVMQHMPVEISELSNSEAREMEENARTREFLSRARKEGVVFSQDVLVDSDLRSSFLRRCIPSPVYAIPAVVAIALILTVGFIPLWQRYSRKVPQVAAQPVSPTPPAISNTDLDKYSQVRLEQAQQSLESAQRRVYELEKKYDRSEQERTTALAEIQRSKVTLSDLRAQFQEQQQALASTKSVVQKISGDRDQAVASLVADESRLRDYENDVVRLQSNLEQERELNSAARDVREMMGARNLHIIDVYDSDTRSHVNRSFGRVIYIEGKSLIFYAFDLDKAHNVKKVSFQAWGEREGDHRDPRKLGTFYVDDLAQRRWVLKVNDPEKLKSIDTVFVTVETHQDVSLPNRERVLQAYLGSRANHP